MYCYVYFSTFWRKINIFLNFVVREDVIFFALSDFFLLTKEGNFDIINKYDF